MDPEGCEGPATKDMRERGEREGGRGRGRGEGERRDEEEKKRKMKIFLCILIDFVWIIYGWTRIETHTHVRSMTNLKMPPMQSRRRWSKWQWLPQV